MNRSVVWALLGAVMLSAPGAALASDLVYTPINPTFGGNPLNSSHLLAVAGAQKTATALDAPVSSASGSTGGTGTSTTQSQADLFLSQLEGRLLSALAGQVTDAIFGTNGTTAQQSGTILFGDTSISFNQTADDITLLITQDGTTTTISVPKLKTN